MKLIREIGFKRLVLGLTGNSLDDDIKQFLEAGVDIVLSKPLRPQQLDKILAYVNANGYESDPNYKLALTDEKMERYYVNDSERWQLEEAERAITAITSPKIAHARRRKKNGSELISRSFISIMSTGTGTGSENNRPNSKESGNSSMESRSVRSFDRKSSVKSGSVESSSVQNVRANTRANRTVGESPTAITTAGNGYNKIARTDASENV